MRTRPGKRLRGAAGVATIVLVTASGVAALASEQTAAAAPPASTCQLGNGVKHVVSLVFDNVHFFRDNPNVPSDLEQMPHLLNFLKSNGTVLSNVHTPLIAHTANDSRIRTRTRPITPMGRPTRRHRSPTGPPRYLTRRTRRRPGTT